MHLFLSLCILTTSSCSDLIAQQALLICQSNLKTMQLYVSSSRFLGYFSILLLLLLLSSLRVKHKMRVSAECSMQKCRSSDCCRWSCCVGSCSQNNHKLIHTLSKRTRARNHDLSSEHNTRAELAHINTGHRATGT